MDKNKIIYVSISAVCILAIIAAIFAQIDQNSGKKNHNNNNNSVTEETKTQEELKKEFNVNKVYIPNGIDIEKCVTHNAKILSEKQIYDKIKHQDDI